MGRNSRPTSESTDGEEGAEAATALSTLLPVPRSCGVRSSPLRAFSRGRAAFAPAWAAAGVAAFLILVLVLVTVKETRGEPPSATSMGFRKDRSIAVGDNAMNSASSTSAPESQGDSVPKLARPLPKKPFPGQRHPLCTPLIETVLRGARWVEIRTKPPAATSHTSEKAGATSLRYPRVANLPRTHRSREAPYRPRQDQTEDQTSLVDPNRVCSA
jgi:hypothetical protein